MDLAVKPGFSGLCNTILLGGKIIDYVYLEADHLFSLWNIAQHHDNVKAETEIQVYLYLCICVFLFSLKIIAWQQYNVSSWTYKCAVLAPSLLSLEIHLIKTQTESQTNL